MSIAPVEGFPPPRNEQSVSAQTASARANARTSRAPAPTKPVSAEDVAPTVSGILPKQESAAAKNVSAPRELPQDVVEVHQDPEIKDQIIIQYLDQSKNVILQVPSAQELNVERGIVQDFQQAVKLRASERAAATASSNEGETNHGD